MGVLTGNHRTTVYVLRDKEHRPLYVGFSQNPITRIATHRRRDWWPQVTQIDFTHFADKDDALEFERDVILRLDPEFNVMHRAAA